MSSSRTLLITILLFGGLLRAQTGGYEVQYVELKGKVKSVRENCFAAKGKNENVRKGKPKREYNTQNDYYVEFNSSGNKVYKEVYKKGSVIRTVNYVYDSLGYLVKETRRNARGSITDSTIMVNEYNADGKPIKRTLIYSENPKATEFFYTYDAAGNIRANFRLADNPTSELKESAVYDASWHLMKGWIYDTRGNVFSTVEYIYNESGKRTSETFRDAKGSVMIIYRWKFAANGMLERREVCRPTGQNCEAWTYKYDFDLTGNWIKAIEYRNGKPVFIKERTITYF